MQDFLLDMLQCPACRGALTWDIRERCADRIEEADARCEACGAHYPVRERIGFFLTPDLPRNDLWEQVESGLTRYLRANPEIKYSLMNVALHTLSPADQFFRAMMLEELGKFAQAKAALDLALPNLYAETHLSCLQSQFDYVVERLAGTESPVVDLASGRGGLAEKLVQHLAVPVVITDFSPRVLRRNLQWFEFLGLSNRISLLAFDARRTPFKDGVVATVTTNQGLPNIEAPGELLEELRRVVHGEFLAITHFYPEDDELNAAALREHGLDTFLFYDSALARFRAAGWSVEAANLCIADAMPTPAGDVLDGMRIDGFPVAATLFEWYVLVAR